MSVDRTDVEHVADLARLRLTDAERVALTDQLRRIVDYFDQLREVNVDDVPPTKHVIEMVNVDRDDEPVQSLDRDRVLEVAPDTNDGYFIVPRIIPS